MDDNVQKIHKIHFQDGNCAAVCEAGNAEFSARAIELIKSTASQTDFSDYRTVADCAQKALSILKQEIREQFKGTAEELQKHLETYSFELMIAHYWAFKPLIFTLRLETGIAITQTKQYCSIGCGSVLADFIISRLDLAKFGSSHGMWTALYAVEEIKRYDSRCGGQTRAAIITNSEAQKGEVLICDNDGFGMKEAIAEAIAYADESKDLWRSTADMRIKNVVANRELKKSAALLGRSGLHQST